MARRQETIHVGGSPVDVNFFTGDSKETVPLVVAMMEGVLPGHAGLGILQGTDMKRSTEEAIAPVAQTYEARGRCSYDGVLPQIRTRQPLSTPAAAAPTHTSTRANRERRWALCSRGRAGRCNGDGGTAQRPCGNGRSPA
jgi:hypothetical protein